MLLLPDKLISSLSCKGLHSPHACGHTGLMQDFEDSNITRPRGMGSSAEFDAEIRNPDPPHLLSILFSEKGRGSGLEGLFHIHNLRFDPHILTDLLINHRLNLFKIPSFDRSKMSEVKPKSLRGHKRSCLMDMAPQNLSQHCLKQVSGCMVEGNRPSSIRIDLESRLHPFLHHSSLHPRLVDYQILQGSERILHLQGEVFLKYHAPVSDLATRLSIKGCLIRDDFDFISFVGRGDRFVPLDQLQNPRFALSLLIAHK